MLDKLTYKQDTRPKKAFWPSDFGKPILDLFFAFNGVEPTNPPNWYDTLKWGAGRGVEESALRVLKQSGIVDEEYNQKENGRIEIERNGVRINGYVDAITKDGQPIEIKSINNANRWDISHYEKNEPRKNYVGQLAIYMDALGVDIGHLFVASIDGLHRFWFECKEGKCGNIEVDVKKEYEKFAKVMSYVEKDELPDIWENHYKIPVDKVDWRTLSKTDISKARNNQKVIGDWQILYSSWKDLIVELQGETLGYTPEELEYIKDVTKGYTKW